MKVTGVRLTPEDVLEGASRQYAAGILRWQVSAFAALIALGGLAFGSYVVPTKKPDIGTGVIVMMCALAYFYGLKAVIYLVVRRGIRRQCRDDELLQETFDVSWSNHGYKATGDNLRSEFPWSSCRGWRSTPNLFLIYISTANYQIIPKRYLSADQEADLRTALKAGGVKERRGLLC